jgi:hypothetical protein
MDSDELLDSLSAGSNSQVDARAFLRARLMDQLMGDWDRHRDQWKWAAAKGRAGTVWRPIPRDRGPGVRPLRRAAPQGRPQAHPKLVVFEPTYPSCWPDLERTRPRPAPAQRAELGRLRFDRRRPGGPGQRRRDRQRAGRLPASFRGDWLELTATALIARRDALPAQAKAYYRQLAVDVDVVLSGGADWAEAEREEDGGSPSRSGASRAAAVLRATLPAGRNRRRSASTSAEAATI